MRPQKNAGLPGAPSAGRSPLTFGVVGLNGFAKSVQRAISHSDSGELAALYSIDLADHPQLVQPLRQRGVRICSSFDELLAQPIEALWLPVPIDLHRPYTVEALRAGKAVMCEKPAAGSVQDVDAMIAARDEMNQTVAIAYSHIYDPTTLRLKRDLLDGCVGRIHTATLHACWPRTSKYYGRSPWAGRMQREGRWVMDSPANNALAHPFNLAMFLLGPTLEASATAVAVEAELYRANPIESFDTCSMRITLTDGGVLMLLFTHASERVVDPIICLHGESGTVRYVKNAIEVETGSARNCRVIVPLSDDDRIMTMIRRFGDEVRSVENAEVALCTLEVARAPLVAINGAVEATPVHPLEDSEYAVRTLEPGVTLHVIPGIESAFQRCVESRQMLHESKLLDWTAPPGQKDLRGYRQFAGPVSRLAPSQAVTGSSLR